MAKTRRRNNKVRNRRTKSRRGGGKTITIKGVKYGPHDPVPYVDRGDLPYDSTAEQAGFVFNKKYQPSTFSLIPPLSSFFSSRGIQKKNMYQKLIKKHQKELNNLLAKTEKTLEDENNIKKLNELIAKYKNDNEAMLRESATRSKYNSVKRAKEMIYYAKQKFNDTKRKLGFGDEEQNSSSDSD